MDFLTKGMINLSMVKYIILDEADRMLDMGFQVDIERIMNTPELRQSGIKKEISMFSATFPPDIKNLARKYMQNPVEIKIGSTDLNTMSFIKQKFAKVDHRDKRVELWKLL
jgi:superfamily II DNA/RNA helicase